MSKTHKPREEAYAIVRIDLDSDVDLPERITVKEVVSSEEIAQREADRLNHINAGKGCLYFSTHTRVFPPGQCAGPES